MSGPGVRVGRSTIRALLSAATPVEIYEEVVATMAERLDAERTVVALDTESGLEATRVAGDAATAPERHHWNDPLDCRVISVREEEPQRIDDLTDCRGAKTESAPRSQMKSDGTMRSLLCVPLEGYGVVFAESTEIRAFSETDQVWLEELASYVVSGLARFETVESTMSETTETSTQQRGLDVDTSPGRFADRIPFVLKTTGSLLWTLDIESETLRLFGPVESILGTDAQREWQPAEFVESFIHPDDADRVLDHVSQVIRGERQRVEVKYRIQLDRNDDDRWIRARAALPDESHSELIGLSTDVTERVSREERIKFLQERTTRLISARSKPRIANIAVNAAGEALTLPLSGIHLRDGDVLEPTAVNEPVWDEFGHMPHYRADSDRPIDAFVWEAFEGGRPVVVEDTTEHEQLSGATSVGSAIVYPLDDYGVFIASATERDAIDSVDVALGEVLAMGIVAALDRSEQEHRLREQAEELERKNERLEEFTSIVSHDLRNPLNVALGRVQYVRSQRDDEHLATAEQALERMEAIIEETLVLARQGHDVTDRSQISLPAMVEQCWQNVQTEDATLSTEFEGDYVVAADRDRLAHVFENLFTNAVEHGSTGPGSHARQDDVDHASEAVTIRVGPLSDGAGFYVEDDGTGIPPSDRETVFETGYTTAEDGTGFGLSLVRDIVEAHGWTIRATEGSDGGARFEIGDVD